MASIVRAKPHTLRGEEWTSYQIGLLEEMLDELYADLDTVGAGTGHNLLSGLHTDSVKASVERGDLIVGQLIGTSTTVAWQRLEVGAAARYIRSDGADVSWAQISETDILDGSLLARVADAETITGVWTHNANLILGSGFYLRSPSNASTGARLIGQPSAGGAVDVGDAIAANNTSVRISTVGTVRWTLSGVNITATLPRLGPVGSASAPTYTVSGGSNTGMYFPSTTSIGLTTGGTLRATINSSGLGVGVIPTSGITVLGADFDPSLIMTERSSVDASGPWFRVLKSRSGGSANVADNLGRYGMAMRNSASAIIPVVAFSGYADNVTAGTEAGYFTMETVTGGSGLIERLRIESAGSVIINEPGNDIDVRIESDTNANHVSVDGGLFGGVGAIAFGAAASDDAFVVINAPSFTASAATTTAKLAFRASGTITVPLGATSLIATVTLDEPNIIATGTIDDAYTLVINSAPTEATRNGAFWVASGLSRFDGRLQFGGTTSSFPGLKRNGTILETRLADDSAYAQHTMELLAITDGITAPGATSGLAKIYVDTADGDLKVVFGDGTVATIALDT